MPITSLLVVCLLSAAPAQPQGAPPDGRPVLEQLRRLEGAWRAKDGHSLTLRVLPGGAVVQTVTTSTGALRSITVFRLDSGELVATQDGEAHATFKLSRSGPGTYTLDDKGSGASLTLQTANADSLAQELALAGKPAQGATYLREYVDTLK